MATTISKNEKSLDQHSEHLREIPADRDLVEDVVTRLMGEGPIGMRCAANVFGSFRDGKPTHSSTVTRWATKGVKLADGQVIKLESFRLNGRLVTSRQAIIRFIQAQQTLLSSPETKQPTPTQLNRAAEKATQQLDTILGRKSSSPSK